MFSSPVDGQWLPWASWSNCSSSCGGVRVRHRGCTSPRYGGQDCSQLPGPSNLPMEISKSFLTQPMRASWTFIDQREIGQNELGQESVFCLTSEPCPDTDGCSNTSCPPGLVRYSCVPCPMSCGHVSSGKACVLPTGICSSGDSKKKQKVSR